MTLRIAAAQFPVSRPLDWAEFESGLRDWVARAAGQGAQLLLFPEYAAMRLTALLPETTPQDLARQLDALQAFRDAYLTLHRGLASEFHVHLIAGSFPWRMDDGNYRNRAWLCSPERAEYQDKIVMTRFEREEWGITGGHELRVFETALGRVAINICYDAEFPLLARAQVEAGAELILVPSCTDALAGYHRVRIGAQARALENQCIVVQSPLIGAAPWSAAIDVSTGCAHVFGPPDLGFPHDGVLASGVLDEPGWVYADVDLASIRRVREQGQVLNHRHWPEQIPVSVINCPL